MKVEVLSTDLNKVRKRTQLRVDKHLKSKVVVTHIESYYQYLN